MVRAAGSVDIVVARAGVALEGRIMQMTLLPILSLSVRPSGKIEACFDVSIELQPLVIQLQARIAYLGCVDWVEVCSNFLGCLKLPILRYVTAA